MRPACLRHQIEGGTHSLVSSLNRVHHLLSCLATSLLHLVE